MGWQRLQSGCIISAPDLDQVGSAHLSGPDQEPGPRSDSTGQALSQPPHRHSDLRLPHMMRKKGRALPSRH